VSNLDFPFQIIRSKRKTAAIHVKANQVQVRIPHFVDDSWAMHFLQGKSSWVKQKLQQQNQYAQTVPKIAHNEKILWLGNSLTLQFDPSVNAVLAEGNELRVPANTSQQALALLEAFFKQQAKRYMVDRTHDIAKKYGLSQKLSSIRFRRTKTKWGHCTSKGVIQYNWLIMGAPVSVIDYLICHELSHLNHPNHSKAFWSHVASMCPDYKNQQIWLKQNSMALSWC